MEKGRKRWAIAALICSIVPIVSIAIFVALFLSLRNVTGEPDAMAALIFILLVGLITAGVMMGMGIISVILGTIAIIKPKTRGKLLATVAI
ncbi:MAG: hypothetical protein ACYSWZ_17485, partial [Planctomycetota bacterium]